jgi:hypothetical protein
LVPRSQVRILAPQLSGTWFGFNRDRSRRHPPSPAVPANQPGSCVSSCARLAKALGRCRERFAFRLACGDDDD